MPVVGSCITGLFAVVGSVSLEVSPVKGITDSYVFSFTIFTTPYRMICIATLFCDMGRIEDGIGYQARAFDMM